MPDMFRQIFEQVMTSGGRSTALKPLGWLLSILILGLLGVARAGLAPWIIETFVIFMALAALLYLAAYVFFMCKNPDALRSERYAIEKLAIEKSVVGDSSRGIVKDVDNLPSAQIEPKRQLEDTSEN
jgi:hypothetical protein